MASALTPRNPQKIIKELNIPFNILVGAEDILFNIKKLRNLCDTSPQLKKFIVKENSNHFSILNQTSEIFKPDAS